MKKFRLKENKLGIIIGSLALVTLMVIIYAVFTGTLNINGTANVRDSVWDIHIVESGQLEPSNTLSSSAKVLTKPTASTLSISNFNLSLITPGDYIEYTFHVVNDGDYDATLSDLDKAGVVCTANGSTSDPEAIKVCNKLEYTLKYDNGANVTEGDTILSKQTQTMVLKIKYQDFNDPTLLPNTNVSISGLGIDISYSQSGNAKVNSDGTTPLVPTYSVGDTITLAGEQYYVIANSDSTKDYVTVLKAKPLTATEINTYGAGHVNMYNVQSAAHTYHTAYDWNDANHTGGMAYYSSINCGYGTDSNHTESGCTTSYNSSEVKYVIDGWAAAKFTSGEIKTVDGYGARLATKEELQPIGWPSCTSIYCSTETDTPSWIYNSNYWYWTMSQWNNSSFGVWDVYNDGYLGRLSVGTDSGAVRPVLNIYKSKI